ncbi:hypothetical protein ACI2KR_06990 [Pseudomonas luteola]
MPRGPFENRYLRFYGEGVQVRIVRLGVNYSRKFHFRIHGNKDLAVQKARRHRDRVYAEIFGHKLVSSSHLLKSRAGSFYPPGISEVRNNTNDEIIALVASWQDKDGKTQREYIPLSVNLESTLKIALEVRMSALKFWIDQED